MGRPNERFDIVIVGSGQAGFPSAISLRQEGFEGASIAIIGDEPGLPYYHEIAVRRDGTERRLVGIGS